jgi:hypothetical protein
MRILHRSRNTPWRQPKTPTFATALATMLVLLPMAGATASAQGARSAQASHQTTSLAGRPLQPTAPGITVGGEPNPQYRNENVGILAQVCDDNKPPTGRVRFTDVTKGIHLGKAVLLPSEDQACSDAILNTRALAPHSQVIVATYLPSGPDPVKGVTSARYLQKILRGGKRNHVVSFRATGDTALAMKGGEFFKHPQGGDAESNDHPAVPPIPTGKFRPRRIVKPASDAGICTLKCGSRHSVRRAATITVNVNTGNAASTCGCPTEPSEASAGNVVIYTTNLSISFSTNGGSSFTTVPANSLYRDTPFGGLDGDQVVQYDPTHDMFLWLVQTWGDAQGNRGYRLTEWSRSQITSTGPSGSWWYWDISAGNFPSLQAGNFDYPDLALGNNYAYLSFVTGGAATGVMTRIGLDNLSNGMNLAAGPHAWRYVVGGSLWGRVAQNTGGSAVWAFNNSNSQVEIDNWPESSNNYTWWHVNDHTWPNSNWTTTTPDGASWASHWPSDTGAILTGARSTARGCCDYWFAWTAGVGSGSLSWLNEVHIELIDIRLSPGGSPSLASQRPIWMRNTALAYPVLTTDQNAAGDLGIAFARGGGARWVDTDVGDLTKSPNFFWWVTNSTAEAGNRWGDYITIRPRYGVERQQVPVGFTVAGYATYQPPGGVVTLDPRFVSYSVS